MELELNKIYQGDSLEVLKTFESESVDCVVTSPPYWGLRDYGVSGQLGLEKTPEAYVAKLVEVFREVKRVLKKEGTFWLNLGDSYASDTKSGGRNDTAKMYGEQSQQLSNHVNIKIEHGLKQKDLIGIPWRVAFALQADGWYLRQDIIWAKPNPMPESVTDRCTKSHEYIFLLTKSPKYYFDNEAIKEPAALESAERLERGVSDHHKNIFGAPGQMPHSMNQPRPNKRKLGGPFGGVQKARAFGAKEQLGTYRQDVGNVFIDNGVRNKRSVWTITTKPFKEAHFATFPEELITPMIKTTRPDALILDPFMGAGTTGWVAKKLGRNYVGIELNPEYIKIAENRIKQTLF